MVAVMINEPKVAKASGGRLAAPLFSKIMANSLRIMDIAPDAIPAFKQAKPAKAKKATKAKSPVQKKLSAVVETGDNT